MVGTPPQLLNNDPDGYAWGVWHDRTPLLLAQIRDAHVYGPEQRAALDALWREISAGNIEPLPAAAHDADRWASWADGNFGKPWADATFLWTESYFFRRLLEAVGFFTPGPWQFADPFAYLKNAELRSAASQTVLAGQDQLKDKPAAEQGQLKLLAALWGNLADLGFRIGQEGEAARAGLVTDDSAALWAALDPPGDVIVVTDNAGQELLADLILIDHLLTTGAATAVRLHVKPQPYYVSDATAADVDGCADRLGRTNATAEASARLRTAAAAGRFSLHTHEFYCAPLAYDAMPPDLARRFAGASLTIMKGDLNYRRLTGDRDWPPVTPFAEVVSYFPGPVAALRTLKSDVVTGVSPARIAGLEQANPKWRTDGSHALIQVALPDQVTVSWGSSDVVMRELAGSLAGRYAVLTARPRVEPVARRTRCHG